MSPGGASLWRNADYVKFWSGETISQFGSQVTLLALPLTAVLTLDASPFEMGVLNAASYLPFLVLTLFVGVLIDRRRRRPLMVVSSLGRAAVLGTIPLLHAFDRLDMTYLVAAALVLGALTVLFEVTYQAYLPSLVTTDELVEGNGKLQLSASAAQVGGPALGGALVGLLTAPVTLVVDAVSFLLSAGSLLAIRTKERPPERDGTGRRPVMRDIREGLRFTFGNRWLRPCVLEAGTYNMFWLVMETAFLLYATRELHMTAGQIGLVLGGGAVGALLGSMAASRLSGRLGLGTTVSLSMLAGCAAPLIVPFTFGPEPVVFALLVVSFFIGGAGTTLANIHVVSLRQTLTPPAMLGRMNASYRFVAWGTVPVGSLLGGVLGGAIGLHPTLFVGAAGTFAAALWIVFSPIRSLREMPPAPGEEEQADEAEQAGKVLR
ncbi:MFS transporter [Actinomadura fulvescens]|uniref:MFS transporter n=1 Tax=Actinomadura fulvescens TaxID=46160 RepID=A0ABN3PIX8_9ACTN